MNIYKNINLIAIIVIALFTIVASVKLINPQFYTTHDGGGHVIRMEEFHDAINDGQFPVRIAKRINYGLGYPYFNFNYPMVYYTADILHRIGFSFVESFKIIMAGSVFMGGLFVYYYLKNFFDKYASLIGSIFYIIVPYRFLNMYVRGTIGEAVGLALMPGLFFAIEYILLGKKRSSIPLFIISSAIIVSHNITALVGGMLAGSYLLLRLFMLKDNRVFYIKKFAIVGIFILASTSFFWYPALVDAPKTKLIELREDYKEFFPVVREVFYSPWGFGPWKTGIFPGKMSPQIGIVHTIILGLIAFYLVSHKIFKKKIKQKATLSYFIAITLIMFYLVFEISRSVWDSIGILQSVQHPWRFVGYIIFAISFFAAYLFNTITSKNWRILSALFFIPLLLYANRNHIRVNQYIDYISPFRDGDFVYTLSTTSKDEHMPIDAPRIYETPNQDGDIIGGDGISTRIKWKSNHHVFDVNTSNPLEFRDNTSYFPGWVAYVNGQKVPIDYKKDEYKRLRVSIPKGANRVEFFFIEPLYRKIVNTISFSSLVLYFAIQVWKKRPAYY